MGVKTDRGAAQRTRVLVVDDAVEVRDGLVALFRAAGYEVTAAESGVAALREIDGPGADVVLTDLVMPEMTGWDLARAIRARNATNARGLPLCLGLYSAVLSGFSREQLARAQIDFALSKLGDPEAVLEAVERALAWSEVE